MDVHVLLEFVLFINIIVALVITSDSIVAAPVSIRRISLITLVAPVL